MKKNIWIPFYYTAKVKRDPSFFIKQVLLEELPIVLLVFGLFGTGLHYRSWIGLGLLFLALISVYEIGYANNDRIGERSEAKPKLTDAFKALGSFRIAPFAWIWAFVFTGLGVAVLPDVVHAHTLGRLSIPFEASSTAAYLALCLVWICLILLSQLIFSVFNNLSLKWRVFAYIPLHVSKYFGFALFFASNLVGLLFLVAHIVRTWSLYAVRRAGGDMDFIASQLVRLFFFVLLLAVLATDRGLAAILSTWQTWIILGFGIVRAVPEVMRKMI